MQVFCESERLVYRELHPSDAEGMFLLDSDPAVHQYLGNKPVAGKGESEKIIEFVRRQYSENGIGRWAIIEKVSGEFIGWGGLKRVHETVHNHSDFIDLGYRLIRKYWGKGYATENAIASLKYGFENLKVNEIFASAHLENKASQHVILKTGFRFGGIILYGDEEHAWYSISRESWINLKNNF